MSKLDSVPGDNDDDDDGDRKDDFRNTDIDPLGVGLPLGGFIVVVVVVVDVGVNNPA